MTDYEIFLNSIRERIREIVLREHQPLESVMFEPESEGFRLVRMKLENIDVEFTWSARVNY